MVARGVEHRLRKFEDRKAQVIEAVVLLAELICALRSKDFLRWCLSPRANSSTLSFSISNSFGINECTYGVLVWGMFGAQ